MDGGKLSNASNPEGRTFAGRQLLALSERDSLIGHHRMTKRGNQKKQTTNAKEGLVKHLVSAAGTSRKGKRKWPMSNFGEALNDARR